MEDISLLEQSKSKTIQKVLKLLKWSAKTINYKPDTKDDRKCHISLHKISSEKVFEFDKQKQ